MAFIDLLCRRLQQASNGVIGNDIAANIGEPQAVIRGVGHRGKNRLTNEFRRLPFLKKKMPIGNGETVAASNQL